MKPMFPQWAAMVCAVAALSGCAMLPRYEAPPAGPDTATIDMSRFVVANVCHHGKAYSLQKPADGKVVVPVDGRIRVTGIAQFMGFNVIYTCTPGISFQPEAGQTYFMNLRALSQGCIMEVYKIDPSEPRVGLTMVPDVAPSARCE